jgi:hypothetical protein
MLLSYGCPSSASSSAPGHPPALAVNEDIRAWWTPVDASQGHWLTIDLGENSTTHAIQVNLAEHEMKAPKRPRSETYQTALWRRYLDMEEHPAEFLLESSADGQEWSVIVDTRRNSTGRTHHFVELEAPSTDRFVRITGFAQPYGGAFAVSGLRVFGRRAVSPPDVVTPSSARIGPLDAKVTWKADPLADGYNVRYGLTPDKLNNCWMVRGQCELVLSSLNAGYEYWAAVDAFNGGGVTRGKPVRIPTSPI